MSDPKTDPIQDVQQEIIEKINEIRWSLLGRNLAEANAHLDWLLNESIDMNNPVFSVAVKNAFFPLDKVSIFDSLSLNSSAVLFNHIIAKIFKLLEKCKVAPQYILEELNKEFGLGMTYWFQVFQPSSPLFTAIINFVRKFDDAVTQILAVWSKRVGAQQKNLWELVSVEQSFAALRTLLNIKTNEEDVLKLVLVSLNKVSPDGIDGWERLAKNAPNVLLQLLILLDKDPHVSEDLRQLKLENFIHIIGAISQLQANRRTRIDSYKGILLGRYLYEHLPLLDKNTTNGSNNVHYLEVINASAMLKKATVEYILSLKNISLTQYKYALKNACPDDIADLCFNDKAPLALYERGNRHKRLRVYLETADNYDDLLAEHSSQLTDEYAELIGEYSSSENIKDDLQLRLATVGKELENSLTCIQLIWARLKVKNQVVPINERANALLQIDVINIEIKILSEKQNSLVMNRESARSSKVRANQWQDELDNLTVVSQAKSDELKRLWDIVRGKSSVPPIQTSSEPPISGDTLAPGTTTSSVASIPSPTTALISAPKATYAVMKPGASSVLIAGAGDNPTKLMLVDLKSNLFGIPDKETPNDPSRANTHQFQQKL